MRIAGKLVDAEERIEVRNPFTGALVGTVPAANPAQVAEPSRSAPPTDRSSPATTARRSSPTRPRSWPSGARRSRI
jgi:acyl-CoA reductase-like NAD-dependent aldehyde dehydrogenase